MSVFSPCPGPMHYRVAMFVRWFWLPMLLLLLAPAIILVILTISRYRSNPTYMVQIETVQDKKKFPCVMLCPPISFADKKMDEFVTEINYTAGMNSSTIRKILPQLGAFFSLDVTYKPTELEKLEQLLNYNGLSVESVGRRLTTTCEEILIKCRWSRIIINCSSLFQMFLTADGFCCVFNGRSLRDELQRQESTNKPLSIPQHRYTNRFGFTSGLIVAVDQTDKPSNIDLSYKWIAVQRSQRFIDTTNNGTALNPGNEDWIAYYTRTFSIGVGAQSLSTQLRKCKMSSETLKYFPNYGKRYCLLESEIANTFKKCNCVRTVHPKPPGVNAKRCSARKLKCAKRAIVPYDSEGYDCPSTCDVDKDFYQVSSFSLIGSAAPVMDPFYADLDLAKVTVVRVFIKNRRQFANERWSYYSQFDLFSQLGGMFSVFFGCSVLTLLALLQIVWRLVATWCRSKLKDKIKNTTNVKKSILKKRI